MKHIELNVGDIVLELSPYRKIRAVIVSNVTTKTVITKMHKTSHLIDRHGEYFGNALFVWDEKIIRKIEELEKIMIDLEKEKYGLIKKLEEIEIGG